MLILSKDKENLFDTACGPVAVAYDEEKKVWDIAGVSDHHYSTLGEYETKGEARRRLMEIAAQAGAVQL